ncbi:multidrug effflux MFS transporter [Aquimixticola soesokkakensis]|uniref:multidrug effflux MFS transporter n=1 Tax=Aquimixticola soesokkakensis TaxID=1519096 RepID=UPI001F46BABD|nr:multidrug effflux MFS transporter [Aquimixticola soesokkakensis]
MSFTPHAPARYLNRQTAPHLSTLVLMMGLQAMAMNIFLPALPQMAEYFGTSYAVMQLAVPMFMGVNAVMQLFIGPTSDRYGRRPLVLWGLAIFMFFTVAAIYAPSVEFFLFCRAGQATIVTSLVLSRAIVRDITQGPRAAEMLAYVTMAMALIPMVSPTVGGLLGAAFGWQAIFWALLGCAAVVSVLAWCDLGETAPRTGGSILAHFANYPVLLKSQRFWGYALCSGFASGGYFAFLGGAPFVGGTLLDLDQGALGIHLGAPAIGYVIGNYMSGRLSARVGINRMILIGGIVSISGLIAALGIFLLHIETPLWFFGLLIPLGLGNGMQIPNSTVGALSVRPEMAGTASGLSGAIMIAAGAVLAGLAGSMLSIESGAFPLLYIMIIVQGSGILCVFWVMRREKVLGLR